MRYKQYDKKTLDRLHDVEIEILLDFDKICKENNLTYFLTGGTMLGAVRHKGFIPWDDDIDIGMPRNDYDNFIKLGPKLLDNKYLLDCFEYNENYFLPFAKIKKNGTVFDEGLYKDGYLHKGIFIDIIPFENVEKINLSLKIRATMVRNIVDTMFYKNKIRKLKNTRRPWFVFVLSILTKKRLMKIQKYFMTKCKNNKSKYINALGGSYNYIKETNLRSDILPTKLIDFEGKRVFGMNKPEVYLSRLFGDYMKLPPKEERVNHVPKKLVFDLKEDSSYDSEDLKKLQRVLQEMLDEVVRICKKYNLNYFLGGGTCLGAIRHKGFIPWDDDIDVIMPREDYEMFLEKARKELDNKYFLDYYKTNDENHFGFAKLKKNNTTFQMGYKYKCHNGFFLDIFPMDYNDNKDSISLKIDVSLARCLLDTLKYKDHNLPRIRSMRRPFISIWFIPFSNMRIHKLIERLYQKHNKGKKINGGVYSGMYFYKKDIYPLDKVFPYSEAEFCGKKYHVFHDTDYYLRGLYGNYLELPPIEKRFAHKPNELDFNKGDVKNTEEEYNKINRK